MTRAYKFAIFASVAFATCMTAVDAFAQPGGGRGRGGPRGFFGGGGSTELLMRDEVREEIMLVDDQQEQLEELQNKFRDSMRSAFQEMRENGGDFNSMREIMEEKRKEMEDGVNDILLPHQLDRLKQLSIQSRMRRSGAQGALESDEVRDRLGLTDEQLEEIREVNREAQEELQEKIAELQLEARKKVLAVLTPEQQRTWEELTGDSFKFADRGQGRGRGREAQGRRGRGTDGENGEERRRGFGRRPE